MRYAMFLVSGFLFLFFLGGYGMVHNEGSDEGKGKTWSTGCNVLSCISKIELDNNEQLRQIVYNHGIIIG
jgi:hypothetical protein